MKDSIQKECGIFCINDASSDPRDDLPLPCCLLNLANYRLWRMPPIRDITDIIIVLTLYRYDTLAKVSSVGSISQFIGVSNATVSRRVKYLSDHGIIACERSGNFIVIKLTPAGIVLIRYFAEVLATPNTDL